MAWNIPNLSERLNLVYLVNCTVQHVCYVSNCVVYDMMYKWLWIYNYNTYNIQMSTRNHSKDDKLGIWVSGIPKQYMQKNPSLVYFHIITITHIITIYLKRADVLSVLNRNIENFRPNFDFIQLIRNAFTFYDGLRFFDLDTILDIQCEMLTFKIRSH